MEDKQYAPHIRKQIEKAGGLDQYKERMKAVRQGQRIVSDEMAEEILSLYETGQTQEEIALVLDIGQTTVSKTIRRARDEAE